MNTPARSLRGLLWLTPILSAVVGCAGVPFARPIIDAVSSEGITEQRQQRNTEFVQQFEQNRDFAEFESARAEWLRDDPAKCEQSLKRILARNPTHRDSLLLTAELYLAENRLDDAFRHGQLAMEAHPEDAQVQYTMGLLLDATGQSGDALVYYERAVQLEPENELYAVGYRTALETSECSEQPVTVLGPPPESLVRQTSLELTEKQVGSLQLGGRGKAKRCPGTAGASPSALPPATRVILRRRRVSACRPEGRCRGLRAALE